MGFLRLFHKLSTEDVSADDAVQLGEAQMRLAKQLAELGARVERLELSYAAFRQRVYAWKRWEDQPTTGSTEAPAGTLDKASILRNHRNKTGG